MHRLASSSLQLTCRTLRDGARLRHIQHGQRCSLCCASFPSTVVYDRHRVHQNRFLSDLDRSSHHSPPLMSPAVHPYRHFHASFVRLNAEPLKPSSKVEETVAVLKEKAKEKQEKEKSSMSSAPAVVGTKAPVAVEKKSLKKRVIDELVHYYHGFRLLFIDINVSRRLLWRVLNGKQLTRRENKLLVRTVGDLFRLVPFSVFIIVPFLEFALPFFIKMFPNMLPSTFQTSSDVEDKIKQSLKVKLEMAKFLQKTIDEMPVTSKGHSSESAKEFAQFFAKLRTSGEMPTSEEIMKFSKLFEDEITLDSLPRPQLMALCRVLDMNPIGTTNFLRFQLRLKLRSLAADDMMIQKEGINSLSQSELQAACRARGMRALGVSEERLKAQLSQWLDLSLVKKVPPSLLLLSQAFMLPETTPTEEKLAATIQALPDVVGTATKAVIGEREGKVDYKTKIDIIKEEVAMIKEERKEQQEEENKILAEEKKKEEVLVDTAPILMEKSTGQDPILRAVLDDIKKSAISEKLSSNDITSKDMEALESALETLGKDTKRLLVEKEELQELREEMAEYQEDIADLQKVLSASENKETDVKETVAAQRLFRKVNKMISKIESALNQLEPKEPVEVKAKDPVQRPDSILVASAVPQTKKPSEDSLRIDDLINTIRKIQGVPESSLEKLNEILLKMDADKDGAIRIDNLLKMLELVGSENVKLSKKQVNELIDLIDKEEAIEMDELILRALKKSEAEREEKAKEAEATDSPPTPTEDKVSDVSPQTIPVATTVSTTSPPLTTSSDKSRSTSSPTTVPPTNKPLDTVTTNIAASMKNSTVNSPVSEPKSSSNHEKLAK